MVRTSAEVEAAQQADLRSELLQQNRAALDGLAPQERLAWAHQTFGEQFALTTSFGIQSSVLLHMLSQLPGGMRSR
jgi:phosphoadenosine phosphosulfate reductase